METRIEGQKEITKARLSGVGSLKTVEHRQRCGVDIELLDKALVVENLKCPSIIGWQWRSDLDSRIVL